MIWPSGKAFAFTVVDDTDLSTVENTKPVYDCLSENGILTTKTVWPLLPMGRAVMGGHSLADAEYREWVLSLQGRGFEIALHGAADGTSLRAETLAGLNRFRQVVGTDPSLHTTHYGQAEGIYWGAERLPPTLRRFYRLYRGPSVKKYGGSDPASPYFWGDLCRERIRFVRNFVFSGINTLKADPLMPYHDWSRPFVPYWFSSSDGSGIAKFCDLLSEANQDRLAAEGGACIVYTHFGSGFYPLPERFRFLMRRLAALGGWFVPASTLLTYVGEQRGWLETQQQPAAFRRLQWRWLIDRARAQQRTMTRAAGA